MFGFRQNTGAIDCVETLVADIYLAFVRKEYLNALFIDIKYAFPSVHIPTLMKIMIEIGIPTPVPHFIGKLMTPLTLHFSLTLILYNVHFFGAFHKAVP